MIPDAVNEPKTRLSTLALAVLLGALVVRLVVVFQSVDNPSFHYPVVDAGAYDQIARGLADSGTLSPRLFWQPFFYPVFLATIYLVSGGSIIAAKIVQAILGAFTCYLVLLLGRRQ